MNPPDHALKHPLPMLEFGMGLNFEAGVLKENDFAGATP